MVIMNISSDTLMFLYVPLHSAMSLARFGMLPELPKSKRDAAFEGIRTPAGKAHEKTLR